MNEVIIKNLSHSFGKQTIFNKLNLTFKGNGLYAIVAPSGYGKSTLFNVISGFIKPDAGLVSVKGKILYSFQNARLFNNLTVKDNLGLLLNDEKITSDKIEAVLKSLGILKYENTKVAKLSSGEYARVLIAEALLSNDDILLLDEPLKYLDKNNRELVLELLRVKAQSKLIIVSGHEPDDFISYAKEIINSWPNESGEVFEDEVVIKTKPQPAYKRLGKSKGKIIRSLATSIVNFIYIFITILFSLASSGLYQKSVSANRKFNDLLHNSNEIATVDVQLKLNNTPRLITNAYIEELTNNEEIESFFPNLLPQFHKYAANGFRVNDLMIQATYYNDKGLQNLPGDDVLKIAISSSVAKTYFNAAKLAEISNRNIEYILNLMFTNTSTNKEYHINIIIPFLIDSIIDHEIDFKALYLSFDDLIAYINKTPFYINEEDENITPLYDYLANSANYLVSGQHRIGCFNVLVEFKDNEKALRYLEKEETYNNQDVIKTNYYIDTIKAMQLFSFVNVNVFTFVLISTQVMLLIVTFIYLFLAAKYIFAPLYLLEIRSYNPKHLNNIKYTMVSLLLLIPPLISLFFFQTSLNTILSLISSGLYIILLLIYMKVNNRFKAYQKLYE